MSQAGDAHSAGDSEPLLSVEDALPTTRAAPTFHPDARRVAGESAGAHVGGGRKITHHTTEGGSAEGAIDAYRSHRGWPHFTVEWSARRLEIIQHLPLEVAARALQNPPDAFETNRARTIQIEHVGFAAETGDWPVARYAAIAELCRWIEDNTGAPRAVMAGVDFADPRRLSAERFHNGAGHHGHVHVPGNTHHDPGRGFRIDLVLDVDPSPHRNFTDGVRGADVTEFQRAVNLRASRCGRQDRRVDVDGIVGPQTLGNGGWAAFILGIGDSPEANAAGGISANVQGLVRDPATRNEEQKQRAGPRRAQECRPT